MQSLRSCWVSITLAGACLAAAPLAEAATKSSLRFDRIKYAPGSCLQITVEDADENASQTIPESVSVRIGSGYPAATSSGDVETLTLVETGPSTGRFKLTQCLPVVVGAGAPENGQFRVHPGDVIAAAYEDPDNPPSPVNPSDIDAGVDTALISGGTPPGQFHYTIDPGLPVPMGGETPGVAPGEPPRPLAMVVAPGDVPQVFGEDQVILRSDRPTEPADFIAERAGTLVEQVTVDDPTPGLGRTYHLVRIDPAQQNLADFAYLMELLGAKGDYVFSSANAVRLAALLLEEQLGGRFVMHNPLLLPHTVPATAEGDCDGNGTSGDNGFTCDPTWMPMAAIGLDRAILYMDLVDSNVAASVSVAFVDGGFAGPGDYGGVNNADFGPAFAAIPQGDCDSGCDGSAAGENPTMCAGDGAGCDWHGTLTFSVAAAVANNGAGAIGVAGHARNGAGADGTRGVIAPILLKIGYPYMTTVARAVEGAVERGAQIVNISSGFPCEPLGGIDICDGGTRAALIASCFAILEVFDPFPGLACGSMLVLFEESGVADFDVLQEAVDDAVDQDIVVVAAGPENVDFPVLGEMGPFDAQDVEMVPCILPGVICAGALDTALAPSAFNTFGSAIDVWAPGEDLATTPIPGNGPANTTFSGTSAAAPFVTGVAALMRALDPTLTATEIGDTLRSTSVGLPGGSPLGDCIPHPDGITPCVGSINAIGALEAIGGALTCSGLEPDANDTPATATAINLAGQGVFTFSAPVGVHALATDEDFYSFNIPNLGAPSTEMQITLDVSAPAHGTLILELSRSSGFGDETIAIVDAADGTASWHGYLEVGWMYFLRIRANAPTTTHDNCYGGTIIFDVVGPGPEEDNFEGGVGNDTPQTAADLTGVAWVHEHFDEDLVEDLPLLVGSRESTDSWTLNITHLSLHDGDDADFLSLPLPDPADGASWPGHSGDVDLGPGVEPMPECGVVERAGIAGEPDTVIFTGVLSITVLPHLAASDDELRIGNAGLALLASGGKLSKTIACPRRELARLGLPKVLFSFGERTGLGDRYVMMDYDLLLEYKIAVQRIPGDPPGGGGGGTPPQGLPCIGGFFGDCLPNGDGWEMGHPFDFPCLMDGCPDDFMFDWAFDRPLELLFTSTVDLRYELFDFDRVKLAEALPLSGGMSSLDTAMTKALAATTPVTKRLFMPTLPRGQYLLVVSGPSGVYRIVYVMRDSDGDGLLDGYDNCPAASNTSQLDSDQDTIGNACDCAPGDSTAWYAPPEVRGLRTLRSALGPSYVELSWTPLAYEIGPGVRYDVVSGSLAALHGSGTFSAYECLAGDVATRSIVEPQALPAAMDGYWYLARAESPCGLGSWGDATPVPDPRDALDTLECAPPAPQLAIAKTDLVDPVPAGGTITYALSFQNTGSGAATSVVVSDAIPSGTAFVSATGGGTPDPGAVVRWNLGTLAPGASGSVQLTVRVTSLTITTVTNGAYSIDSAETAPVSGAPATTGVLPPPIVAIDLNPATPLAIDSARTISITSATLDVGVIVNASGTAGIRDIARIAFGVTNAFNTNGATVTSITPLAIVDLMPPAVAPNNATFGVLAGEFQLGGTLIERGVAAGAYLGGAVQYARFRITFGARTVGSTVRVFIGDAGPASAAVRAAAGADISGDITADGTPVGGVAGSDQGAGAGLNYMDATITFAP